MSEIKKPLAEEVLFGIYSKGGNAHIDAEGEKFVFGKP